MRFHAFGQTSVVPHKYVASIRRATGKLNPEKSGGYATHQGLKDVILFVRQHTSAMAAESLRCYRTPKEWGYACAAAALSPVGARRG